MHEERTCRSIWLSLWLLLPVCAWAAEPIAVSTLPSGEPVYVDSTRGIFRISGNAVVAITSERFGIYQAVDFTAAGDSFFVTLTVPGVSDRNGYYTRLGRWNLQGRKTGDWAFGHQGGYLTGVAVDPVRHVAYCLDSRQGEIYKLDLNSSRSQFVSSVRIRDRAILGPMVLDLKQRRLLLADALQGRIFAVRLDSSRVDVLVEKSNIAEPAALAYDTVNDRLYVADTAKGRVWVFAHLSKKPTVTALTGSPKFKSPVGVALSSDGTIWIVDRQESSLSQFTIDGKMLKKVKL